jgi:hypothetical protein
MVVKSRVLPHSLFMVFDTRSVMWCYMLVYCKLDNEE